MTTAPSKLSNGRLALASIEIGAADPPPSDGQCEAGERTPIQLADIAYFVTDDDTSERRVPGKHRREFSETRVGLTVGIHHGGDGLTAWLTLDVSKPPVLVITDVNGCLVSDGEPRTADQHVDVAAVTAFVIRTWQCLLADAEVREHLKSLNTLRPLMEVRAAALGMTVGHYLRDLVAEARKASFREYDTAQAARISPPTEGS